MVSVESLKQKASGLAGAISPGDARAVAQVLSDLCANVRDLGNEVSELKGRLQNAEKEIVQLREEVGSRP
jgi:predicted RNase H-like nuclease (RuvC/YqgF family)